MSNTTTTQTSPTGFNIRGLLVSIVINAAIPFLLYTLSKKYISSSEVVALSIAALFPIFDSIFGIIRHRQTAHRRRAVAVARQPPVFAPALDAGVFFQIREPPVLVLEFRHFENRQDEHDFSE